MRPKLLDLFAGGQGAGVGYARAGFDVEAVDVVRHDRHPEIAGFMVADALELLSLPGFLAGYDVIHASPPCQGFTTMSNRWRGAGGKADSHPDLISWVRINLQAWGGPYVIENVVGARREMRDPILLRGGMFGLQVDRPRLFESSVPLSVPPSEKVVDPIGVYGKSHDGRRLFTRKDGSTQRAARTLEEGQDAMGIDWMEWADLTEAIPPAYTEHLGTQLIDHLARAAA